jgi:transposase
MDVANDGSWVDRPRRIEVLNGAERRRHWSDEAKARIVGESMLPGAMVSQVARRHDVLASQIYAWRKAARAGSLVLSDGPAFATVEAAGPLPPTSRPEQAGVVPIIEIEAGPIVVRVNGGADAALVERIVRALKVAR